MDNEDKKDFKLPVYDGMSLPLFKPLKDDAEKRFQEIKNLDIKPDDIILTSFPRSGTHWLWEILIMLTTGKAEYTTAIKENAFLECVDNFDFVENMQSPRILNTHLHYRYLPAKFVENGGKNVHIIRNPKDRLVSNYFFMKDRMKHLADMPWKEFFDKATNDPMFHIYGSWFAYEKEFEEAAKTNNSLYILYYEDLKTNPIEEIRKIADFLSLNPTDQLVQDIASKCSFTNLKKAHSEVKITDSDAKHYRKGETGDWKNYFTVAENERFDQLYKEEMKHSNLDIKYE